MGLHMRNMASAGFKSWSTSVMALGQLSSPAEMPADQRW